MDNPYNISKQDKLILRDYLALDRTVLALERTFLAYARTALGLFSAGIACIKFILDSPLIYVLGMVLVTAAPIVFIYGIVRYIAVRDKLKTINALQASLDEQEQSRQECSEQ